MTVKEINSLAEFKEIVCSVTFERSVVPVRGLME
jgi:hypothetical protein